RRRHTRSYGDWSSDVCSSDLPPPPVVRASATQQLGEDEGRWRDKAAERREAMRSAEQRVAALKAQLDQMQRHAGGQGTIEDLARSEERRVGKEWRRRRCGTNE